jgi:hypothetical protein
MRLTNAQPDDESATALSGASVAAMTRVLLGLTLAPPSAARSDLQACVR